MPQVNTVLGPVEADQLGVTAVHERILFGVPGWEHHAGLAFNRAAAFEKVKQDLLDFREAGGQTLVDCTGLASGRNIEFYQALSRSTGVNIVACTGFREERMIPGHYHPDRVGPPGSVFTFYKVFRSEIVDVMSVPHMRRSTARAGLIMTGNSKSVISEVEVNAYRGAAQAAKETGVPVFTHGPSMARQHVELLLSEGLAPDRIVVSHCDAVPDQERDLALAGQGVYIGYDRAGEDGTSDDQRAKMVKALADAGFASRILISCDTIGHALGVDQPKRGYAYLLKEFVPRLRKEGLSDDTIKTLLVENPKRVLGG